MFINGAARMPSVPSASSFRSPQNFLPVENAWQYSNNGQAACSPNAPLHNNQDHDMQQPAATPPVQFQAQAYTEHRMQDGIDFQQHQSHSHTGQSHPNPQSLYGQLSNSPGHAMLQSRVNSAANPQTNLNQLQSQVSSLTLDLPTQRQLVHRLRCLFGTKQREVERLKRDLLKAQSDLGSSNQALQSQSERMDKSWMTKTKHAKEMAKQQEKMIKSEQEELTSLRQQYKSEQFALRKESERQRQEFMSWIDSNDDVCARAREHVVSLEQRVTEQTEKLRERSRIIQEMEKRDQSIDYHMGWLYPGYNAS